MRMTRLKKPGMTRGLWQPSRRWLPLAGVVLGLLLIPGGASAKSHSPALFWGAQIGDQLTGEKAPWDMRAVDSFEQITRKGLSLIGFNSPFTECVGESCAFVNFPRVPLESIRGYGAIPV